MEFGVPAYDGVHGHDDKGNRIMDCASLFLDSGAHSLYNEYVVPNMGRDKSRRYDYYGTQEFRDYLDTYAEFIKRNKHRMDCYATVDVIYNPELSWESLKYLEENHGLNPVPVIHERTPLKWVDKYLASGYTYLGIGGLGQQSSFHTYSRWADKLFSLLCPKSNDFLPVCKTHGFAMTGFELMRRYPWYSVDSASWAIAAANGMIYIPQKRNGVYTFSTEPYFVCCSMQHKRGMSTPSKRHYHSLTPMEKGLMKEWLDMVKVPLGLYEKESGESIRDGALSHYGTRATLNLFFYQAFVDALPPYPWPFTRTVRKGFFE